MTLEHRIVPPAAPSGRPPLVVLLHGLGADEEDLLPLAPHLDPRLLVISVRAPLPASAGYAWYGVDWARDPPRRDPGQVLASRDRLLGFVEEAVAAHRADAERVFLLGFSQGAMISLAAGLARPELIRGVVAHSGRLLPEAVPEPPPAALARLEVLLLHGRSDEVVPARRGREARDALAPLLERRVAYREWPWLGHRNSRLSRRAAARWLGARLG